MSTSEDESPRTPLKTGDDLSSIVQNLDANTANQTPKEIEREQQAILDSLQSKRTNDSTETEKTTISPSTKVQNKKEKRKYDDDDDKEDLGRNNLDLLLEAVASDLIDESNSSEKESLVLEGEVISPLAKKRQKEVGYCRNLAAKKKGPKQKQGPRHKQSPSKKEPEEQIPKKLL